MNKHDPTQPLLSALLRHYSDEAPDAPPAIADTRLREVLRGGTAFTPAERHLMLQSPATRERFIALAHRERATVRQAWGQTPVFACLAAATSGQNEIKIENAACELRLIKLDSQGRRWKIWLRLADTFRRHSAGGVRVVDDTGREWLAGQLDAEGELSGLWPFEESPVAWVPYHPANLEPR